MEYSYFPFADSAMLCYVALCTDKDGVSHIYLVPNAMQTSNSASATCLDMCEIPVDYQEDRFYDYLHNYFKLSKCSLNVI